VSVIRTSLAIVPAALGAATVATASSNGISFNWEISVGNIVTWLGLMGVGSWWLATAHSDLRTLRATVTDLKNTLEGLRSVLATLGRHEEKFIALQATDERHEIEFGNIRRTIESLASRHTRPKSVD
jgi:hypothetical protein